MTTNASILIVDEERFMHSALKRSFRHMRTEWDIRFADNPDDALKAMTTRPADVIISALQFSGRNGIQLLEDVCDQFPQTVRIVLSGCVDRDALLNSFKVAHQYLTKPFEDDDLIAAINAAFFIKKLLDNASLQTVVSRIDSLPSLPSLYIKLTEELKSEDASVSKIGDLISKDPGMTARLLKLANSSFFGRPLSISDPVKAVSMLGIDMVQAVVLTAGISEDFKRLKVKGFSMEGIWDHAVITASLCKAIAQNQGFEKKIINNTFTAGLLHDIGKLLIASHLRDSFAEIINHMNKHGTTMVAAEQQILGTTHAAIGAYLLGLWGLPVPIVEAVAHHHCPSEKDNNDLISLALVHTANVFANRGRRLTGDDNIIDWLDAAFLDRAGLLDNLDQWQSISIDHLNAIQ